MVDFDEAILAFSAAKYLFLKCSNVFGGESMSLLAVPELLLVVQPAKNIDKLSICMIEHV